MNSENIDINVQIDNKKYGIIQKGTGLNRANKKGQI